MIKFNLFSGKRKAARSTANFLKYPSKEKRRIIEKAVSGSIKMQEDLIRRYEKLRSA